MITYKFSPHPPAFQKKLKNLSKKMPAAIQLLNKKAFTKLPWENFEHLKKIQLPKKNRGEKNQRKPHPWLRRPLKGIDNDSGFAIIKKDYEKRKISGNTII